MHDIIVDPASFQSCAYNINSSVEELFEDTVPGMQKILMHLVHENFSLKELLASRTSDMETATLKLELDKLHARNVEITEELKKAKSVSVDTDHTERLYVDISRKNEEIVRLKRKNKEIVESCQKWRSKCTKSAA